jgi:acetate kinase
MSKIILSCNAGSSSVKISVYRASQGQEPEELAEVQIDNITAPPPDMKYTRAGVEICKGKKLDASVHSQITAFQHILDLLFKDEKFPGINAWADVAIVNHRIVQGGDFPGPVIVQGDIYDRIAELTELAPLHNATALEIIKFMVDDFPHIKNVAMFDTSYHHTMPEHIKTYPINQEIAKAHKLKKYGAHGTSYEFITREVAQFLGKKEEDTNIIACHLGSGASVCAIKGGKSWDTSMGLTPLAGLPGATRSGSIDPSLIFHYAPNVSNLSPNATKALQITRAEEILNKEAGWKALTGTANFGIIASSSEPKMKLAYDIFIDRVLSFVGSYYVSLGGKVDALVFAAGIGERSDRLRADVATQANCLGFEIDNVANKKKIVDTVQDIGKADAKHRTLVCQTNEQFEMARFVAMDKAFFN